jgi:hypothetical protein
VELAGEQVGQFDGGREGVVAVGGLCGDHLGVVRNREIRMDEIEIRFVTQAGPISGFRVARNCGIPPHVGDLEARRLFETAHGPGHDAEPGHARAFLAGVEEQNLVAEADAEVGFAGGDPVADGEQVAVFSWPCNRRRIPRPAG